LLKTTVKLIRWAGVLLAAVLITILAVRAYDAQRGPALRVWHKIVPSELEADAIAASDWDGYLAAEERLFAEVRREVAEGLEPEDQIPANRYFAGGPLDPARFETDWNRSFVLEPDSPPLGAAVLLHGLTDAPYSQRHIAQRYRERGHVAIGIRLPAHGTVPGALTRVHWEDWAAATRLAVREAERRVGPERPIEIVGYSNGGALALQYALDALEDPGLRRPDRVVLISPMIGVTALARFAGVVGWPAVFPAFAGAAWLSVIPEFNPFKYNSFPVNGARQSSLLSRALQHQVVRLGRANRLAELAPVLTFQSVVDFTVSTPAVVSGLYAHLPPNGSELVVFDVNRDTKVGSLVRPDVETALERLLPPPPRHFRTTSITNASAETDAMVERVVAAGATSEQDRPLGLAYPRQVFSLSHIALPFPVHDGLYGLEPDPNDDFGVKLGALAPRGEVGVLILPLDSLTRVSSNPFFPYLLQRIDEGIDGAPPLDDTGAALP
jgi:alpha-beta hydrolase superfamily lysophospholipase